MQNTDAYTVVAGVDGSPQSHEALAWAAEEARIRGGRLVAVTAWELPILTTGGYETVSMDREAFASVAAGLLDSALQTLTRGMSPFRRWSVTDRRRRSSSKPPKTRTWWS
ncbi:hypothetical protein AHiyo8_pI68980 (plasmid) [Arthrobacter sp. Hiyo8]|nr:hypothetical protein AHiyo8_pI68980 [Arthrobacter sp. Hiyo8]